MKPPRIRAWRRLLPLLATAVACAAADKFDPKRVTPVPADQPIPVTDFYRPVLMRSPDINKAGTHIAAPALVSEDKYLLMVHDLATKKTEFAGAPADRDVHNFWWAGDQHVMYSVNARKLEYYDVAIAVGEVGKIDRAYPFVQYAGARLVRVPDAKPMEPLVWMSSGNERSHDEGVSVMNANRNSGMFLDLLALVVPDGDRSDVKDRNIAHTMETYPVPGGGLTRRYICNADDSLAFAITEQDGVPALQHLAGRTWQKCPVNLDEIEIVDAGNQPGELVVLGPRQPDKARALQFMDGVTGKLGEVLLQDPEYDFNGFLYRDRTTHKILGAYYVRNGPTVAWFDETLREIQKAFDAQFKGERVNILGWNTAMTRFVVGHYNDRHPIAYEWIDLEKKTAIPISQTQPWLDAARMQPMQMFKFKTKDGRKLDAYLTLPAGASPQHPVPLVVIPHDGLPYNGPTQRDAWGFDAEAQFFASRGYAVLRPNYRGSPGYNWAFPHEDEWDLVKMHEDVTAATNTVVRTKLIDRNRIAIMGTGFGGYLAVCGVADEPALYRCAVTIDGVYDWSSMIAEKKYSQADNPDYGWLMRRLGAFGNARLDSISPIRRVNQIKVPVFVAFSKGTSPVEVGQPNALLSGLDRNHVPHEAMIINDERHGFGYLDKKFELYERIEGFLAQNLGGR